MVLCHDCVKRAACVIRNSMYVAKSVQIVVLHLQNQGKRLVVPKIPRLLLGITQVVVVL